MTRIGAAIAIWWLTLLPSAAGPPHVLFIAVDDLNDWVTCLGGRAGMHTPNLDRLAAKGVLFANAHCAAPSCNPSRVAVMTGVAPYRSGIYHNGQHWRRSPRLKEAVTIPEHFRANGYRAIGGGKIFHALSWITNSYGAQQNDPSLWDSYFPEAGKPLPPTLWPTAAKIKRSEHSVRWPRIAGAGIEKAPAYFFDWAPVDGPEELMADAKVVDWAAADLAMERPKPVFQAVGIFRPHIPWFVPQKYFDLYPLDQVALPKIQPGDLDDCSPVGRRFCRRGWQKWLVDHDQWRGAVQGYLASISFADAQVGRLLDALDRSPHAKDTVVVLWSDHGMHIGEKEHWEKFTLWEESTRVPLIIVAPGVTKAGAVCQRPVSLLDVYPTLVELCGLPARKDLDGRSLVPLLRDPAGAWPHPAVTTWGRGNASARSDHQRYIRYHNGDEEFYDHKTDPDEFKNAAADPKWKEEIAALREALPKDFAPKAP